MYSEDKDIIEYLVIDDEKLIHSLVIRMLRSCGFNNFRSVYGANEALRVMRRQNVGFVITDWIMPQMTGIELIKVIREDPQLFATPILVLTGVCTAEGVMCAMEEGADGYLVKPFTALNLKRTILSIELGKMDSFQTRMTDMTRLKLQGAYDDAVEVGRELLETKRDPNVLFMMGECLARSKRYRDAVEVLEESALGEKCGKSNNLIGKIFMEQGDSERGIGRLEEASDRCQLILHRKVDLAEAYLKAGQEEEAEEVVEHVLRSSPTNLILADLGRIYLEHDDIERAGSFLENGVIPTPETTPIFNNYAISLRRHGQYEQSEAIYRKCIELVPDSFALYFNAGLVYRLMKDHVRAKEMFKQALRLNPAYEPAKVFLKMME